MNLNGITPDWVNLTHDAKGQLTHAEGYGTTLGFVHDVFGNNTSATANPAPVWLNPFAFTGTWLTNQMPSTQADGKWTGWDPNSPRGEATQLGTKVDSMVTILPSWDGLGRLSGITLPGVNQAHLYAPSGMRVHLSDSSDVTRSRRFDYTSTGMLLSEYAPARAGHASNQAVRVMHATGNAGALSRKLGAFAAGDTVEVTVWFKAPIGSSGALAIHDGRPGEADDSKRFVSMVGTGGWQPMTLSLTLGRADTLWVHLYGDMYTSTSGNESSFVDYDDLLVKKNGANWMQDGFESGLNVGSDPQSTTGYYACAAGLASLRTTDGSPDQWKRDVVYVGGRAIAEIDTEGIHELHTDHLGTPRIITAGSAGMTEAGQPVALGHVEGRQAFAPYGELVNNATWTNGYAPLTGYTGHIQQDPTGLIYMRGRYYSPAWHRFLNSDLGVDPNQSNQFSYVGGRPLTGSDPSGLTAVYLNGHYMGNNGVSWGPDEPMGGLWTGDGIAPVGWNSGKTTYFLNTKSGKLVMLIGWTSRVGELEVGHWAAAMYMQNDAGDWGWQIILSTFPEHRSLAANNQSIIDIDQLRAKEGRDPDGAFFVEVGDLGAFFTEAIKQGETKYWTATGCFGTQCVVSVSSALIASQAPMMGFDGSTPFRWPNSLMDRLNRLMNSGVGGVYNAWQESRHSFPGLFK